VLRDQFADRITNVNFLQGLCNPADKNDQNKAPPQPDNPSDVHLSCYSITDAPGQPLFLRRQAEITTQNFGQDTVTISTPAELCVSARKNEEGSIIGPAWKCYNASSPQRAFPIVSLDDQFFVDAQRDPSRLSRFCTPVGINNPDPAEEETADPNTWQHLACYETPSVALLPNQINVNLLDQFIQSAVGQDITFTVEFERRFCEPARKIPVTP
jgi:hypothetical protein